MYRLVAAIPAHEGPIKALWSSDTKTVITGGQDSVVRLWSIVQTEANISISEALSPLYHSHWITAVAQLNPNCHPQYPDGLIVTGCMDNTIRLFDLGGNLVGQLVGHEKPVISFSWTENFSLVSGSWDGTARKWNLQSFLCTVACKGHENGVHVLCLDNDTLVTVSTGEQVNNKPANFRLRLWSLTSGQMLGQPIEDHSGPIRSVFSIPGIGFGTTSNDGTLAFRSADGQCVGVCTHDPQEEGYPPFLLDGTAVYFPDTIGGAVTCGEDGSVVVWKGTELYQSIPHPACVWAVSTLGSQGTDIVTACHDGFLRIFSRNAALTELPSAVDLQCQFEMEVETARLAKKRGPSQEEIQKSPKWENRMSIPGTSEGQVRIFNKDGIAIAAQWSAVSAMWIEIGEVTGSAGSSDGGELNGITYDHIIPVEIEAPGGLQELKLGYNDAESHFTAAQRFIDSNMLDQGYLRQIADFIAARAGTSSQPTFDLTSASTSAGPATAAAAPPPTLAQPRSSPSFKTFPSPIFFSFDDVANMNQLRKLSGKLSEFNDSLSDDSVKLSPAELETISDLVKVLGETSFYHSSVISSAHLAVVLKTIQLWDEDKLLFPSYDLLRMVALHPSGASTLASSRHLSTILKRALNLLSMEASAAASLASPQSLLSLRCLANLFKSDALRAASLALLCQELQWTQLTGLLPVFLTAPKKTHRSASLVFLCNLLFAAFNPQLNSSNNSSNKPLLLLSSGKLLADLFPCLLLALRSESESLDSILKGLATLGTIFMFASSSRDSEVVSSVSGSGAEIKALLMNLRETWPRGESNDSSSVVAVAQSVDEVLKALELVFRS